MSDLPSHVPKTIVTIHERQDLFPTSETIEDNSEFVTTTQLYDAVYKNAFLPMYIAGENGKIINFNEKFSNLFGFLPSEIENLKSSDFFKTNDNSFISFIENRNDKGFAKAEVNCIKKSGEVFPCRISSVFYQSDNGEKRFMNTLVNTSDHISARWNVAG
ncbi:MAG: PAS domain-containing protein [Ginsengibacter sp.]